MQIIVIKCRLISISRDWLIWLTNNCSDGWKQSHTNNHR